uniref:Uncharacterized protein n=1 Tax=Sphaerodactylus townsendi TaxID=933632 RepID=A0ACB8E6T9_9SAUR
MGRKKLQPKRLGAQSQEREEEEEEEEEETEHKAKDSVSKARQVSEAFRSKWQSHQEDEVSQVNNPKKLLEKRSKNIS